MSEYPVETLRREDAYAMREMDALLAREGIARDPHLDESLGIFDGQDRLIATGSSFGNTLRCLAVDGAHQGEGLMARVVTALMERQAARGNRAVFVYTKPAAARQFETLGFHEICRVPGLVFLENSRTAFSAYLAQLAALRGAGRAAAVVMNANPFTRGHQYLLERAAAENETVHCFVVSEDRSLVPAKARLDLVRAGSAGLPGVRVHPSGSYIISAATFPTYFLGDEDAVVRTHARLDIAVFTRIAAALGIARRYVGEEPLSHVTALYNEVMCEELPRAGIGVTVIPRKQAQGAPISATRVRALLLSGELEALRPLVPETTLAYFQSPAGRETLAAMRRRQGGA